MEDRKADDGGEDGSHLHVRLAIIHPHLSHAIVFYFSSEIPEQSPVLLGIGYIERQEEGGAEDDGCHQTCAGRRRL